MKKIIKNKKTKDKLAMAVAIALIAFSAMMIVVTFSRFSNADREAQIHQLKASETSVDYNIEESTTRFARQMDYVLASRQFERAIEIYEEAAGTHDSGSISDLMANSSLGNIPYFEAVLITKDGETLASSAEPDAYAIGRRIAGDQYGCSDADGNGYLAVRREVDGGYICYGIINIQSMYKGILQGTGAENEQIMLYMRAGDAIFYGNSDRIRTCKGSEIGTAADLDVDEAEYLRGCEKDGSIVTDEYAKAGREKHKEVFGIRAVPSAKTENGVFAIAVAYDYSAMSALMRSTATRVILFFLIAVIGIIMLIFFLIKSRREQTQADHELERLKEKNKQMEELNEKLQELEHHQRLETIGTMTSGIAHEFNNLLAPIMGYSIMTLEKLDPDDEVLYDGVLEIYNASRKAKEIISRLSDLARKNTEKVFVKMEPDPLVNRAIKVTSPSLPLNVDMVRDFKCKGRCINGNETQLSQLLINLIINAFQALKEDGGTVTVRTEAKDGYIVFNVEDDGPGIKEEIQQSIFDPFFTTKEAGAGTGLGLAIVFQAVEDHGGKVELESEEGRGSCFRVFIPEDAEGFTDELDEEHRSFSLY